MASPITENFQKRLKELLPPGAGLLLAVSGGSDSMGLFHLAASLRNTMGLGIVVGFVDHGLRKGVDEEFALVADLAERLGVPVVKRAISKADAVKAAESGSIQSWARERRYALLLDIARENALTAIATGHTLDDQAETVMLRILRGCGIDGLQGILPCRPLSDDVLLIRPMLDLKRGEIRAYLAENGIPFADDPSNDNDRFSRVRVRKTLLPLMEAFQPGAARRVAAVADDAAQAVSFIESNYLTSKNAFKPLRLGGGLKVPYHVFERLPRGMWGRVIRKALREVKGDLLRYERCHIAPIEPHIAKRSSTGALPLPGDTEAYVSRGDLLVFPAPRPASPTGAGLPIAIGSGRWNLKFAGLGALAEVTAPEFSYVEGIEMRTRRPGDRIFGSSKRFKEVLIRSRVPRPYRDFVPVLALNDEIISCPGFLPSRKVELEVSWFFDDHAPFLDIDFL